MKPTFSFFLIISLFLVSCPKDKTEPPTNAITITGITVRDEVGFPLGEVDSTDWTYDAVFPDAVTQLLNFTDTLDYTNADTCSPSITAFPNPAANLFVIHAGISKQTIMKFIIVDESLKVYARNSVLLHSANQIYSISTDSHFPANKYYRMYYTFYDKTKTAYYKGHGDLKKK
jgi:hypothetical protein